MCNKQIMTLIDDNGDDDELIVACSMHIRLSRSIDKRNFRFNSKSSNLRHSHSLEYEEASTIDKRMRPPGAATFKEAAQQYVDEICSMSSTAEECAVVFTALRRAAHVVRSNQ